MKNRFTRSSLAVAVACACTCLSYNASAEMMLEEVIVTANKREQSLQDIPSPISAMTGDMLEDRGITEPKDLAKIVPSMVTGRGNRGEPTINIRGVGFNEVGSPGVAIHVDGVYQPRPGMGLLAQYDVQRVEILRGPQSTLYGRNANGGVINYITTSPEEEFGGSITVGIADYGQKKISGTVNAPINDDWGARLSLTGMERSDGFYENIIATGTDTGTIDHNYGGRLVVDGIVSDTVSLKVTAAYADADSAPQSTVPLAPSYNPALAADTVPTGDFEIAHGGENFLETSYEALSVIVNWDLSDDWSLASITGYQAFELERSGDFDFLETDLVRNSVSEESTTFTQEFNLSGSIGDVDSVLGLFYMDDQAEYRSFFIFPIGFGPLPASPNPTLNTNNPYYDTTSIALFADATWNVSDDLRLIGGIRYSDDQQSVGQDVLVFGPPGSSPCSLGTVVPFDVDGTSTIGRLGAQYDLGENSNVYGTYSQGVKTGGVNIRSGCQDVYEDEEITSYEIGYKTQSDDGRLSANISAFFYDYTDLQTNQIEGLASTINNAPGAEVQGLEFDGAWLPNNYWTVNANLSFLDATYSEDFFNVNAAIPAPPGAGVPVNVKGNQLNYAPKVSTNISVGYTTDPVLAGGIIDLRLDATYRSKVTLREFDTENDRNGHIRLFGISAKWLSASEYYSVRLYVENLTDEAYYEFASASNQTGQLFATWNTPRQYGLELKASF